MSEKNYLENNHLENNYLSVQKETGNGLQFCVAVENASSALGISFFSQGGQEMSDFDGAKPVKTIRDDEFKIKIVDGASGATATDILSIVQAGDAYVAGTNDFGVPVMGKDGSGNAIILPVPLPITDNDESITVDATDLDIRNLVFADDKVDVSGSTVTFDNTTIEVTQGTDPWVVSATDLDIRDLDYSQDNLQIKDAAGDALAINTDGSINVVSAGEAGTLKNEYATQATVGVGSETLFGFAVTNAKTAWGKTLLVGARGQVKIRYGLSADGTTITTVKGVYFQDPKENRQIDLSFLSLLGDGTAKLMVGCTNLDASTSDFYCNIQYREV